MPLVIPSCYKLGFSYPMLNKPAEPAEPAK